MTKDYSFFLGRIHFTSDNGSQSAFAYQTILDKLELTKDRGTDHAFIWKLKGVFISKRHYILLSCISQNVLNIEWE